MYRMTHDEFDIAMGYMTKAEEKEYDFNEITFELGCLLDTLNEWSYKDARYLAKELRDYADKLEEIGK